MLSEVRGKLILELLNSAGPMNRPGCLVIMGNVFLNSNFSSLGRNKVIRLEALVLQPTEPDFDWIEPGGVRRHTIHLKV